MPTTYTQEQLDALTAAIVQGALRVKYNDKEVEYRSLNDMLRLQGIMEASLGIGKSTEDRRNTTSFDKDYITRTRY